MAGLDDRADEQRRRAELSDQIVRPEDFAGALVERVELEVRARREKPIADDERRRVRAGAAAEIGDARRVLVFPQRLAGGGVHADDDFFGVPRSAAWLADAVHRVEPALVDEDCRVAVAERPAPDDRRPGLGHESASRGPSVIMKLRFGPPHCRHDARGPPRRPLGLADPERVGLLHLPQPSRVGRHRSATRRRGSARRTTWSATR